MDFSGASLKLQAEGEDKVLGVLDKIDQKAQQATRDWGRLTTEQVNKSAAAFDEMYGKQSSGLQKLTQYEREVSAEHVARMRQQAAADREAERAQNALARAQGQVEAAANRTGTGVLSVSRAFEVMARTGRESGRSLDTVLSQIGYMAFGFGAQGALVGAVAIGTAAIIELFSRTSREMDKLADTYQHAIESIAKSGSVLRADQAKQEAYTGDPFAEITGRNKGESDVQFLARSKGLLGLEAEAKRLNVELDKIHNQKGPADEATLRDIKEYNDRLDQVNREVGLLGTQWSKANTLEDSFLKKAVEEQNQAAKRARERREERADSRSVGEYSNDELNRIVRRIAASHELAPALTQEGTLIGALRVQEDGLRYELERGNLTADQRIAKMKELERTVRELDDAMSHTVSLLPGSTLRVNPKVADLSAANDYDKQQVDAIKKSGEKMKQEADRVANEIGRTLARGITDGIKTWFSGGNFVDGFKAMTAAILDGLGQMFAQVAEKALIGSVIMQKVIAAIQSMNPWVAAVAAGALLAFGNSLRSSGGSGSGGGGGYGASGSGSLPGIVNTGVVTAASPNSVVTNPASIQSRAMQSNTFYVIGEDPKAWRQVQERLDSNARRS